MKKKSDYFTNIFEKGTCAASITSYCNVQITLCILPHLNRSARRKIDPGYGSTSRLNLSHIFSSNKFDYEHFSKD